MTFQLAPGKRIAIVGPSGAGKTTLANLLLRFWDYSQGQISVGWPRPARAIPRSRSGGRSAASPSAPGSSTTPSGKTCCWPVPLPPRRRFRQAAQRAQIHDFILGLPQGYETVIGERGYASERGERQRLAIARLLLKDAPIFLLDEPTANLDPLTERRILDTLFSLAGGHSLLLITHRLVGLENMDEILVLDHGRILERGTQAELLNRGGLYRRLWDLQNRMLADE